MQRTKLTLQRLSNEELTTGVWYGISAYAEKTGFTTQTIRNWVRSGRLEARSYRGKIVVKPANQEA